MDPISTALVATLGGLLKSGLDLIAGAVMAKGKSAIEDTLGVDIDSALTTPEGVATLKQLQIEYTRVLTAEVSDYNQRVVDLETLRVQDMMNARHMHMTDAGQEDLFTKRFTYFLAALWSVFSASLFTALIFVPIPETNQRFADTILGFMLATIVGTIISYFFGTTRQSTLKDSTIRTLAAKAEK